MESTFNIPLWVSIPFLIMLLAIAVGPLILGKWWDKNKNKLLISLILSVPVIIYMKHIKATIATKKEIRPALIDS